MSTQKFNIGDKVVITQGHYQGLKGTISEMCSTWVSIHSVKKRILYIVKVISNSKDRTTHPLLISTNTINLFSYELAKRS